MRRENMEAIKKPFLNNIFYQKLPVFFLAESVFENNLINDLPAEEATPAIKIFRNTKKFLENHKPSTPITFHFLPPWILRKQLLYQNFNRMIIELLFDEPNPYP